jgi:spore coat polysaccharide biosynthesis predicted glycosyltransferase SpsG
LIFDSYEKSLHDGFIQRSYWKNVVLVADSSTPKYQADLVFHPNIIAESLDFDYSDFHSGPLYIPFRKSIAEINRCHEKNTKLRILIVGGGTDPLNFVGNVGLLLSQMKESFQVSLLTNKNSFDFLDSRFETIQIGSSFDSLVASSDLVFTTAGSASLEFVAKGIAIGIGCAVKNQEKNYKNLVNLGMALPIGDHFLGEWKFDSSAINKLITDEELRISLRENCNNFVDFEGASRIVDLILKL